MSQAGQDQEKVEPWLRGPLDGVNAAVMPVFFSFQQVREDLRQHTGDLTMEQIWKPIGKSSVGFHLKHIAGSVDRLSTYLSGAPLSDQQLTQLQQEKEADANATALLAAVDASLQGAEQVFRSIHPDSLYQPRFVGRQHLPTTVLGLLVHLAEHTQRHLGQAITLSQLV